MCGRYAITKAVKKTKSIVQNVEGVEDTDNFNAYPTQLLPIIKKDQDNLTLSNYHWGFIPKWSEKMQDTRRISSDQSRLVMHQRRLQLQPHDSRLHRKHCCPAMQKGGCTDRATRGVAVSPGYYSAVSIPTDQGRTGMGVGQC